jgi:hypothetical protein
MNRLSSIVLSSTNDTFGEELVLSAASNPHAAWVADTEIQYRFSEGSLWLQEVDTDVESSVAPRYSHNGEEFSLFYLGGDYSLNEMPFDLLNNLFSDPVTVDDGPVDLFAVPEHSDEFKVVYTKGGDLLQRTKSDSTWSSESTLASEGSDITSVTVGSDDGYDLIAYTVDSTLSFLDDPAFGVPADIVHTEELNNAVVRLSETYDFDLVFEKKDGSGRRISHVSRDSGSVSTSEIADATDINYNPDVFVDEDGKAYSVWISNGYLNYRERVGSSWVGLDDASYVDNADADSEPKVVFSNGYPRILYKKSGAMYYNGLSAFDDDSGFEGEYYATAWGATKLVEDSKTAINSTSVSNSLSQRVIFRQDTISFGGVSCYLTKKIDDINVDFTLTLKIFYSDVNGNPFSTPLASSTLSSADVTTDGWYEFSFSFDSLVSPADGFCFVLSQADGNEDNYIAWTHSRDGGLDARFSSDNTSWTVESGITRSLRVRDSFDVFENIINSDPSKITKQLVTPPAKEAVDAQVEEPELSEGTFVGTEIVQADEPEPYYTYGTPVDPPDPSDPIDPTTPEGAVRQFERIYGGIDSLDNSSRVVLSQPNLILSLVLDSSGSSGWTDLFGFRKTFSKLLVDRLTDQYPKDVRFDVVKFGGLLLDSFDVSIPKRVRGVIVDVNDTSRVTGVDQNGDPLDISDISALLESGVVSYGFKNLKSTGEYVVYGFDLGWKKVLFNDVDESWHDMWASGGPSLTVDSNGPEDAETLNVDVSSDVRNMIRLSSSENEQTIRSRLTSSTSSGSSTFNVEDATGFLVDDKLVVSDKNFYQIGFDTTLVNESFDIVSVDRPSAFSVSFSDGGFLETFDQVLLELGWEDTLQFEFFVIDPTESGPITFFVQTSAGAMIEWTFTPMVEWELLNLAFIDESVPIDIDAVNSDGDPVPDGTTVEFFIDKKPDESFFGTEEPAGPANIGLVKDGLIGDTVLFVTPGTLSNVSRNDTIAVTDDTRNFGDLTSSPHVSIVTGVDDDEGTVTIADPLTSEFLVENGAAIIVPAPDSEDLDFPLKKRMNIVPNMVDITPIYTGSQLPTDLFEELDPPQADPSADPDDYNDDIERVRQNSIETLLNDGYSAVRLLPVTEDHFLTEEVKEALSKSMFNLSAREQIERRARDEARSGAATTTTTTTTTTQTTTLVPVYYDGIPDFEIDHKVTIFAGEASTDMTTSATKLSPVTLGDLTSPNALDRRTYDVRTYNINPVLTFFDEDEEILARMLLTPFDMLFASPIRMENTVITKTTFEGCTKEGSDGELITFDQEVAGVFATSGDTFSIEYEIEEKDFPLRDGTLIVSLYDARRNEFTARVPDVDLGTINGCGDEENLSGGENFFSVDDPTDEYEIRKASVLPADDYFDEVDYPTVQEIAIVDGKASLTLPALDREALIEIHAEVRISGFEKQINIQQVYYRSPLVIQIFGMGPKSADGVSKYNIGAKVTLFGTDPVPDGTVVSFEAGKTPLAPSVSQTESNIADGVILGPHEQVVQEPLATLPTGEEIPSAQEKKETETITAEVILGTFKATSEGQVIWGNPDDSLAVTNFFFYASAINPNTNNKNVWADGVDYFVMTGDLPESIDRGFPLVEDIAPELIEENLGAVVYGPGLLAEKRLVRWSAEKPTEGPFTTSLFFPEGGWATTRVFINEFIGRPPFREPSDPPKIPAPCQAPECREVTMYTRSRKFGVTGQGIDSSTVSFPTETIFGGEAPIPRAQIFPFEPLGITMQIEPIDRSEYQLNSWREQPLGASPKAPGYDRYEHPLVRDGVARYFIVAEITWRDEFIRGTSDNPLPDVFFAPGEVIFDDKGQEIESFIGTDEFLLSVTKAVVEHSRTTFDADHFHEVTLNEDGVGQTTATISSTKGVMIDDHVHLVDLSKDADEIISSAVAVDGDDNAFEHTHVLRSVAIVGGGPTSNQALNLAIEGSVNYDNGKLQSDGSRVQRDLNNYAFAVPSKETIPGTGGPGEEDEESEVFLEIIPPLETFGTGISPAVKTKKSGDEDGSTILFKAYRKLSDGTEVPLEDGVRVYATFTFFEPLDNSEEESGSILLTTEEKDKVYSILNVEARLGGIPDEVVATKQIAVKSNINWVPEISVAGALKEPTSDQTSIDEAIDTITELGASEMNDALALAANRIIELGEDFDDWKKAIVLVSDGGENTSDISFDAAIDSINSIDGAEEVSIFSIKLTDTDLFDLLVMKKFADDTKGKLFKVGSFSPSASDTADRVIDELLSTDTFPINNGTYTNVIDIGVSNTSGSTDAENRTTSGTSKIFETLRFLVVVKSGTQLTFRIRFSDDGVNFGDYIVVPGVPTESTTVSEFEFDLTTLNSSSSTVTIGRFMEYEVTFAGNADSFTTPEFAGVEFEYLEPSSFTLFFRPFETGSSETFVSGPSGSSQDEGGRAGETVSGDDAAGTSPGDFIGNDNYVGKIIFTHEGDIPVTSDLGYGISHDNTIEDRDFFSAQQPLFKDGFGGIVLSRYNESVKTVDNKNYTVVNGGWNETFDVSVYRLTQASPRGELVEASEYSTEPITGVISFSQTQPANHKFTVTLTLKPFYKVAVVMENKGRESIVLDYLSWMYKSVNRTRLSALGDHREIDSLLDTDYESLGLSSLGTISISNRFYNTDFGLDSDSYIDVATLDGILYALVKSGDNILVKSFNVNFTLIADFTLSNISKTPTGFDIANDNWHVVYEDDDGFKSNRYDKEFVYVDTVDISTSFMHGEEFTGKISINENTWYVTGDDHIFTFSLSWLHEDTFDIGVRLDGPLTTDDSGINAIGILRDVLWVVDFDGTLKTLYNLGERSDFTGLTKASDFIASAETNIAQLSTS